MEDCGCDIKQNHCVLIVEDNITNQMVLRSILEKLNCHVKIAENGYMAVRNVSEYRYDIIFMDVQMPLMSGFEATEKIRSLPGNEKLPIIAVTALVRPEDRDKCLQSGMNEHLGKPINPEQIADILKRYIEPGNITD